MGSPLNEFDRVGILFTEVSGLRIHYNKYSISPISLADFRIDCIHTLMRSSISKCIFSGISTSLEKPLEFLKAGLLWKTRQKDIMDVKLHFIS